MKPELSFILCCLVLPGALGLAGCGPMDGYIRAAQLRLDPCRGAAEQVFQPFERNFDVMGVKESNDQYFLHALTYGDVITRNDVLVIVIDGFDAFQDWRGQHPAENYPVAFATEQVQPGQPLPTGDQRFFGPARARVTAGLSLTKSCPDSTATLDAADGWVHFDQLATEEGRNVTCTFQFHLIDRRQSCTDADQDGSPDCIMAADASGELHFRVRGARPYEDFSD